MNYTASVADFFKSPKWLPNLFLGGVCFLIPILGPMVVLGWLVTGFWSRADEDFVAFPAFQFAHFDKYLERGIWPFLVSLMSSIVIVPLVSLLMIAVAVMGSFSSGADHVAGSVFAVIVLLFLLLLVIAALVLMMVVMVPLKLRAAMTQDFAKAFDFRFVKQFVALVWVEIVLSVLFVTLAGVLLFCLGALFFCVGAYLSIVVGYFAGTHLHKQLYALYLSRGGEPVPLSPKLFDAPPPLAAGA